MKAMYEVNWRRDADAYKLGQEEMRERAAVEAMDYGEFSSIVAAAIRALPLKEYVE